MDQGLIRQSEYKVGVGLRPTHYPFLEKNPKLNVNWFEAISENYMDSEGRPLQMLQKIRSQYPVALHGVSLSIASADQPNPRYLKKLKTLIDRIDPFIVSDHLCWTGTSDLGNLHDLLPFPFHEEALQTILRNVDQVQSVLRRAILLENVSSYMTFKESHFTEQDFITEVAKKSGSKILLDINNVFVNATNHGFDAKKYLDRIPTELIGQIHLAGPTDYGDFLFDTHSTAVPDEVWNLFRHIAPRLQQVPILVEWDDHIPEFDVLEAEAIKAREILKEASL